VRDGDRRGRRVDPGDPPEFVGGVRDRLSVGRGGARGPCFGAGARRVLHAHLSCERAGHVRAAEDREYKQGQRERGLDERLSALACVMTISGGTTLGYAFIVRVSVSSQNLGMEADEVSKRQAEFHLLDVREDDEWAAGHIDGAQHIPLGELSARLGEVPKDRTIVAVCRSGGRSEAAVRGLRKLGYEAENLEGGVNAWDRAKLPLVDKSGGRGRVI
jgi:rhodanese-related sulfurtransferase